MKCCERDRDGDGNCDRHPSNAQLRVAKKRRDALDEVIRYAGHRSWCQDIATNNNPCPCGYERARKAFDRVYKL
jgi:hypothetical protein